MKTLYLFSLLALIPPVINLTSSRNINVSAPQPPKFKERTFILQKDAKQHILAHNLWDKKRGKIEGHVDKKGKKKQGSTKWQLKGIKDYEFAVIETDGELKKYYIGDELPNETYLKQIILGGIVVQNKTEENYIYLFGKKQK